jgi:hypothetical protein
MLKQQILRESLYITLHGDTFDFLKTYQRIKKTWGGGNEEKYSNLCKRMLGMSKK